MADAQSRRELFLKVAGAAVAPTVALPALDATQSQPTPQQPPDVSTSNAFRNASSVADSVTGHLGKIADKVAASAGTQVESSALKRQNPDEWSQLQNRAESYLSAEQNSLHSGFRFSSFEEDSSFRMQNVEMLLGEMSVLLERGLATRSAWNQLQAAAFNVKMQLQNYFEIDKIHQEETVSGFYDHTPRETELDAAAQQIAQMTMEGQSNAINQINDQFYNTSTQNVIVQNAYIMAYLSHLADYQAGSQSQLNSYAVFTGQQAENSCLKAGSAAEGTANISFALAQAWLWAQLAASQGGASSAAQKARSSSVRSAWEAKNAGFRLRRTEVVRRLTDTKADAYTRPGGPLNYPEQMDRLRMTFHRDLKDALSRVTAASEGLGKLYGYTAPLPSSVSTLLSGGQLTPAAFDECLIWVRNAISYLTRFAQTDQRYSFSVAVTSQISKDQFAQGRKLEIPGPPPALRDWTKWTFDVPRSLFENQYYVRLRGISIFVVGAHGNGVWTGRISPPAHSFCEHFDSQQPVLLDQTNIRSSMAGRISSRNDIRTPEVVGASTFYNISPFGTWQIEIYRTSSEGDAVDTISNVILELHLAMRMRA